MAEFVCPACTYPSRRDGSCDNPVCGANPDVTQSQKDAWQAATEKRRADEAERERLRQIRLRAGAHW